MPNVCNVVNINVMGNCPLFFVSEKVKNTLPDIVLKILTSSFPFSNRYIFHLKPVTLMPDEEKQTLLENLELEAEEEEKKP